MTTIIFDPDKHLSRTDQERVAELAREAGMEVGDYIEVVLKKALFATIQPHINPAPTPEGREAA